MIVMIVSTTATATSERKKLGVMLIMAEIIS